MMCDGEWNGAASYRKLMKEFPGTSQPNIEKMAIQASRFIRVCRGSEDEIRERILTMISKGVQLSFDAEKSIFDPIDKEWRTIRQPDLKALEMFLRFHAEVHGLISHDAKRPIIKESVDVPIDELKKVLSQLGYDVTRKELHDGSANSAEQAIEETASSGAVETD